jgi:outer membrane protein OmpA-like peptidoglycan-associated protein
MATISPYLRKGTERASVRRRQLAVGAALTAILSGSVLLTGCGAAPDTPKIIVVVASATANEPAPVLSPSDRAMLRSAGDTSTRASAFVVDPNTGQAREVSLTPRRPDGQVDHGPERSRRLAANVDRVQQMLDTLAARMPFDLLAMISQAVRVTAQTGTLLVLSSGLSTAGGLDMRQVGWGSGPHTVAVSLSRRGLLPQLSGWHVLFSGLADTAGRQPGLPLPQRTILTRYWLALCHAAEAASCGTDAVTRPDPPSRSLTPVPVVPVPRVWSFRGPHGRTTNIPADAFFAFNSSRLLPGANVILEPLATKARRKYLKITIVGYASPDGGSDAYNLALSARRARAVRARLIALGVSPSLIVKAVGLGTAGKPRSACYRKGHLDEATCARLRHVEITLHSAPAAGS